jgi:hypothetical protein
LGARGRIAVTEKGIMPPKRTDRQKENGNEEKMA